ncbi:3-dehydroquinate synthase [Algoriphagus sediminis]|uniref:3-dehydroquinate synthase n=1 Tax=Algoriphagus sediminis TaxID=3057113 RepID=A0ABT7Y841_9BACT|nr:3-dehydroquinate synthase [Algoriphagus sediminis]MDN3202677.1 3-dehydroquinate synthase [Algoriphagus sediminis]
MNKILFSKNLTPEIQEITREINPSQILLICDENTHTHCLPKVGNLEIPDENVFVATPGEGNKNLKTCELIWDMMTKAKLDRKALVINLGGGVITDMGGFCASIYKRGIRFINIPTTLLSQVDASVGGKLGIDFQGLKNHLGVFNEPEAVIVSPEFLETLPKSELRSGFAEIMKHGLISNSDYFDSLDLTNWKHSNWPEIIRKSVEIKQLVVVNDPKETGQRKILNFGHTIGHALESFYLDGSNHLLHGEAIAIGMICEAHLSNVINGMSEEELEKITGAFLTVFGKNDIPEEDIESIVDLCLQDKKNEGNSLLFSLLNSIGDCAYNIPVTRSQIVQSIQFYRNLAS